MFIENFTRPSIQLVYQIVLTLNKIIQSEMRNEFIRYELTELMMTMYNKPQ